MAAQEYIVSFRRGKSMANVVGEHKELAAYVKALGLTVVEVNPDDESVRISATDTQLAPLRQPLGSVCRIEKSVKTAARVAGTS